ncbi:MAG TPA: NAD-dependent malic enzyme [Vicinamibacteria bacterium]|nr:NAD-dependent malic enzyme [Vicinamibacteria bacterium]
MEPYRLERGEDGRAFVRMRYREHALLNHPMFNKSTAFTPEERLRFGLDGLLPSAVSTMEQQAARAYGNIARKTDPLERFIGLAALQDRNEILFYRVLADHLEEFLPIVYTPTVGRACQEFSRIFRRARGLWITPAQKGRIFEALGNAPFEDVRLVVATDNERILGLGDQGAGGMGIPVGKLALYVAAAGIHPARTLPISLDVGTDNQALLDDDLYLGWRRPRLRGREYDDLVDEFVAAVRKRFPGALLQWEDFKQWNAFKLLDRYRTVLPSFNDDIQGTAATALAGLIAGGRALGRPLAEQRIVMVGAGAAGTGIARLIRAALVREGLQGDELLRALSLVDLDGLVVDSDVEYRRGLSWPQALAAQHGLGPGQPRDLAAVVRAVRPTALIGASGAPGAFTEEAVREMARHVERPLIFPLSNPTTSAEATPGDLLAWTGGRALVATGSPFGSVEFGGRTVPVGQGNNAFVFPGVGLGALVAEAREVTHSMFAAAAFALASFVAESDLAEGTLYPPMGRLRAVTVKVAEAVVREARDRGVGRPLTDAEIPGAIASFMWEPEYPELVSE